MAQRDSLRQEFGPLFRRLASRYFEPVRFVSKAELDLSHVSQRGFVVHVMRTSAWLNYLYLAWALVSRGLPPIRAAVNLRRWPTRPWRRMAIRGGLDVRLTYARRNLGSAVLFLKRAAIGSARGRQFKEDPFPSLVALARKTTPVYLVPELFVWEKAWQPLRPRLVDYLFGSPEAPGPLYTLAAFLRNYRRAQFRVGEPIDLKQFINEHPGDSDAIIARKVRSALHHHLARETRAVFGPPRKSADRVIEETLRDRNLRRAIERCAEAEQRPLDLVARRARRHLTAIAARPQPTLVMLVEPLIQWVFNRIYSGIEVDEAGLDRAMKAATRAPVVFCPSHRSHIDYLVMSYVLWDRGYSVPLVAAGANLSFFPLGQIFRRGGAFFLRRSFKGDALYTAVFKAYLKKLVHDGMHQEFFPEGGRSRTGKLLTPKLGMLTWEVEAILEGARNDLNFVPVSIDYERVVESTSYCAELAGAEKKPEDLKALLTAPRVLASDYGRIHLSFDEPISLAQFMQTRELSIAAGVSNGEKKALVRALGHRIMYGIDRVSTLTPHALASAALLSRGHRGGLSSRELGQRVALLRQIATEESRPISLALENSPSNPDAPGPIQEALSTFISAGAVERTEVDGQSMYVAVEEKRSQLTFYKNSLINLMAPRSLVANGLLALTGSAPEEEVRQQALFLSRLFKFEFIYRVGSTFEALFFEAVEKLVRGGLIVHSSPNLSVAAGPDGRSQLKFIAGLLRDYLESYLIAALALRSLSLGGAIERKTFVQNALDIGRSELLAGRLEATESISRPTIENAVTFFLDQGLLIEDGKRLKIHPTAGSRACEILIARIRPFLRPT